MAEYVIPDELTLTMSVVTPTIYEENKIEVIQKNGTTLPITNKTVNITFKTSEITNDSGYIDKDVSDLTNYTKTDDFADVAFTNDYTDLDNKPTNVSSFTNDAGYITSAEVPEVKSPTITNVSIDNISDDKAKIHYTIQTGIANKSTMSDIYTVDNYGNVISVKHIWGDGTGSLFIDGLSSNTTYTSKIVSHGDKQLSSFSSQVSFTTTSPFIPSAYQAVDYLRTNSNIFNTGINANGNTQVYMKCMPMQSVSDYKCFFGSRSSSPYTSEFAIWQISNTRWRDNYYNDSGTYFNTEDIYLNKVIIIKDKNVTQIEVNDTIYNESYTSLTTFTGLDIYLSGCNEGGTAVLINDLKIYGDVYINNGTTEADLFPVMRKSDEVVGFYDIISGTFHSTSFDKGNNTTYTQSQWNLN